MASRKKGNTNRKKMAASTEAAQLLIIFASAFTFIYAKLNSCLAEQPML
jgi:hypothetical protein